MKNPIKALGLTFVVCLMLCGPIFYGLRQQAHAQNVSVTRTETYPSQVDRPQVNPNSARVLNLSKVNTADGRKEVLTVETVPGVVCVIVSGAMAPGTSTSCVRY